MTTMLAKVKRCGGVANSPDSYAGKGELVNQVLSPQSHDAISVKIYINIKIINRYKTRKQ